MPTQLRDIMTEDVLSAAPEDTLGEVATRMVERGVGSVVVFEAATLVALSAYGVSSSQALPAALVLHLVNLVPYLLAGGVVLHRATRADPQPSRTSGSPVATVRRPPRS